METGPQPATEECGNDTKTPTAEVVLCEVCAKVRAIYKCPACTMRTCSVGCVKKHKALTSCSGVRDRTKFIPLEKMGDNSLLSGPLLTPVVRFPAPDFRFLEDTLRTATVAKRAERELFRPSTKAVPPEEGPERGRVVVVELPADLARSLTESRRRRPTTRHCDATHAGPQLSNEGALSNSHSMPPSNTVTWHIPRMIARFVDEAAHRGTRVKILPGGFSRHEENTSLFHVASSSLFWHVEWLFPASGQLRLVDHWSADTTVHCRLIAVPLRQCFRANDCCCVALAPCPASSAS